MINTVKSYLKDISYKNYVIASAICISVVIINIICGNGLQLLFLFSFPEMDFDLQQLLIKVCNYLVLIFCCKIYMISNKGQEKLKLPLLLFFLGAILIEKIWFIYMRGFEYYFIPNIYISGLRTVVVTAILEEMIFRKWMMDYLKSRNLSPVFIIAFTTFLFYMMHFSFDNHMLIVLGLICGYAYRRGKNIKYAIFCHAFHNLLTIVYNQYLISQSM